MDNYTSRGACSFRLRFEHVEAEWRAPTPADLYTMLPLEYRAGTAPVGCFDYAMDPFGGEAGPAEATGQEERDTPSSPARPRITEVLTSPQTKRAMERFAECVRGLKESAGHPEATPNEGLLGDLRADWRHCDPDTIIAVDTGPGGWAFVKAGDIIHPAPPVGGA